MFTKKLSHLIRHFLRSIYSILNSMQYSDLLNIFQHPWKLHWRKRIYIFYPVCLSSIRLESSTCKVKQWSSPSIYKLWESITSSQTSKLVSSVWFTGYIQQTWIRGYLPSERKGGKEFLKKKKKSVLIRIPVFHMAWMVSVKLFGKFFSFFCCLVAKACLTLWPHGL